ncbi:hypothetical protein [Aquimarina sp. 2201CG5-10]|uniref:hypothetical protein n=1 Tax=Aquimarina callyspongiae TaxID=3098150 RepID=UPI002AB4F575|nr:hypothetical protein [Aquimarina sp. 2201CG5-10]MDY8134153.1 hypothetical protein [Aquimarina sp. 2201CG5-10]
MFLTIEYTVTAIVCLISSIVIQRIFSKEKRRGADQKAIEGIKWFGLAIFVWGLGALINLIFVVGLHWISTNKILIYLGVLISLANSLCIILSLPSIEHQQKPGIVVRMVERFNVREFISLYCGVLGMIAFVFIASSWGNLEISNNFIWLIDIPISMVVAISLLFELNKAFVSRQMKFMYLPTFVLFILIVIAVSHRIIPQDRALQFIDQEFWGVLGSITAISFKFLFILLFSILLYSWKFLSENEQQQNLVQKLEVQKSKLQKENKQLQLANESHIHTIGVLKNNLETLQATSRIEFSERQKEVLGYLAHYGDHKSYTEIAQEMHISTDGFQTHVHQIKKMLNISGSSGKEQLIAFAKANSFLKYTSLKDNT